MLNKLAFSLTTSIISGFIIMFLSIWNVLTQFGEKFLNLFEDLYPTLFQKDPTSLLNSLDYVFINTLFAAIDGFIIGMAFVSIYNLLSNKIDNKKKNNSDNNNVDSEKEVLPIEE